MANRNQRRLKKLARRARAQQRAYRRAAKATASDAAVSHYENSPLGMAIEVGGLVQ